MNGVILPYLPIGLWLLAGAMTILLLLVVFGFYIYWRRRQTACLEDAADVAELAAKKQLLQADLDAMRRWMEEQKAELERLTSEREEQERLRALLSDLEQQCATKDQENQGLRNEVGELENQRYILAQTLEKLEREIGDLNAKRAEAETIDGRLAELRIKLNEAQEAVRGLSETQARLEALSPEKASLERAVEDLKAATDSARTEAEQHRKQAAQAQAESEEAKGKLADARKERAQLGIMADALHQEQKALRRDVEGLEERIKKLKSLSQQAEKDTNQHTKAANQARAEVQEAGRKLADIQKDRLRVKMEIGELTARKTVLEQEVVQLEGKVGPGPALGPEDSLAAYADLLEKAPACLDRNAFSEKREKQEESAVLQRLKNDLQEEGLFFSMRVINAFHTSLKCHDINPLTVLAGVSGTGKTLLPMRYAEMMGMHSLVMAVQPRWDSPQDMFGFYNYLEKEYKATELSRSLVRMDPYNFKSKEYSMLDSDWTKDRLLLVLLDEMNLARTEYYFSEFLSKLELRRGVRDPKVTHERSQAEIELDAGPGQHRFRLWVGDNIFFVGSLNEDETTQTLSDKVLDRANVIRFGKPDEKATTTGEDRHSQSVNEKYLSLSQWQTWKQKLDEGAGWYEQVVVWVRQLNAALDRVGRPFGFRVQQAIGQYVANYPRVEDSGRYKLGFADQVEQKIIPKLRGIDLGNETANECLNEVEAVIDELGDDELRDAFDKGRTESENLGMFQWRGVTRKTEEENV